MLLVNWLCGRRHTAKGTYHLTETDEAIVIQPPGCTSKPSPLNEATTTADSRSSSSSKDSPHGKRDRKQSKKELNQSMARSKCVDLQTFTPMTVTPRRKCAAVNMHDRDHLTEKNCTSAKADSPTPRASNAGRVNRRQLTSYRWKSRLLPVQARERELSNGWAGACGGIANTHSRSQPHTVISSIPAVGGFAFGGISGAGGLKKGKRERENSLWGRKKYCAQVTWAWGKFGGSGTFSHGVPSFFRGSLTDRKPHVLSVTHIDCLLLR